MERLHQFIHSYYPEMYLYKRLDTRLLWLNRYIERYQVTSEDQFLNQFSFATLLPQQAEHAAEIVKPCLAVAERYGGSGIGFHGGGARAAIINEAVVKGVGRNQLTGIGGDNLHSTGDLHIYHAVKEVVLSNLLSKLLPLGVGDTHGLIYLDDEAEALEGEGESCIRVLLVRDHCLRLGSFLSPRNFKPHNKKNRSLILSHLAVRSIHLEIERAVSSKNLVEILGVCLQNHANQFAFARCALIAHNAISESNLCFDGRWIDLTVSGFVNSGKNYLQASSFYSEHKIIINFIMEFSYTYSKYTRKPLNPVPLVNYYLEQFSAYQAVYSGYYFGFSDRMMSIACTDPNWKPISEEVLQIIIDNTDFEVCLPAYSSLDKLNVYIEKIYLEVISGTTDAQPRKEIPFLKVIESIKSELGKTFSTLNFIKLLVVRSTMRFYFKQCFHSDTLSMEIINICDNVDGVDDFIEKKRSVSIFMDRDYESTLSVMIYQKDGVTIKYCTELGAFILSNGYIQKAEVLPIRLVKYFPEFGVCIDKNYEFKLYEEFIKILQMKFLSLQLVGNIDG